MMIVRNRGMVVQQHLVYFIKAKRYPWVKIGMSRDIVTTDKRLAHIAAREPFAVVLMGVSTTITELSAHQDLAEYRLRSEWFRWNKRVSDYVKRLCDLYLRRKDGDDLWAEIVYAAETVAHNARHSGVVEELHRLTESA